MARNKRPAVKDAQAESSDSEQLNNSDQETDGSESDSDDATIPNSKTNVADNKAPIPESESGSGSESETDSDAEPPNFTIEPTQSKEEPPSPVKSSIKSGSKRATESDAELGLKELKKAKVEDVGVKKATVFKRLFSLEDEVALLEGISAFQAKKGVDPYVEISQFHEFIKESIHFDVTPNQLKEKIRKLKCKYLGLVEKSGENPVIAKPHDSKVFQLSQKLWGSTSTSNVASNVATGKVKKNSKATEKVSAKKSSKAAVKKSSKAKNDDDVIEGGITLGLASRGEEAKKQKRSESTKKKVGGEGKENRVGADGKEEDNAEEEEAEEEDFSVKFPLCVATLTAVEGLPEKSKDFWLHKLNLLGKTKLEYYEAKLEEIKSAEVELFVRKTQLINEQLSLLLDVSKKSK